MVRGLPRSGAVVVVHDADRRRQLEREIAAVHGTAAAKLVVVRVVADRTAAVEHLTGRRVPILLDPRWRQVAAPHLVELVELLADAANLYTEALALLAVAAPTRQRASDSPKA